MSRITKVLKLTRATNRIIFDAQVSILKNSFKTAKQIARVYTKAGSKVYKVSKKVIKDSLDLAIENQKDIISTSKEAFSDAKSTIKDADLLKKKESKKKELKIDDLL